MGLALREDAAHEVLALARAIATHDGAVRRIETCIRSFEQSSWRQVVWRFSALSTDGCPLQFDFTTGDDRFRFTSEVAGPETAARARLGLAVDLIARLGGARPPADMLKRWESLQSEFVLRWGAWLGVRSEIAGAGLKLYLEIPRDAAAPAEVDVESIVPSSRALMIGYDCARRTEELYYRQPQMSEREIDVFLAFMRAAPERRAVLDAFAELCCLPARAALQWTNFGYSIARRAPESDVDFALFVRSRTVGNVSRIRRQFLDRDARSARRSAYERLVGSIAEDRLPDHEMITFFARDRGEVAMRVGLSAIALVDERGLVGWRI